MASRRSNGERKVLEFPNESDNSLEQSWDATSCCAALRLRIVYETTWSYGMPVLSAALLSTACL